MKRPLSMTSNSACGSRAGECAPAPAAAGDRARRKDHASTGHGTGQLLRFRFRERAVAEAVAHRIVAHESCPVGGVRLRSRMTSSGYATASVASMMALIPVAGGQRRTLLKILVGDRVPCRSKASTKSLLLSAGGGDTGGRATRLRRHPRRPPR